MERTKDSSMNAESPFPTFGHNTEDELNAMDKEDTDGNGKWAWVGTSQTSFIEQFSNASLEVTKGTSTNSMTWRQLAGRLSSRREQTSGKTMEEDG